METVEELIRNAINEGEFSNLPGSGKPLRLVENPFAESEWRIAYHLLKENGFSLPWIENRKEIEAKTEKARCDLACVWAWRKNEIANNGSNGLTEGEWRRAVDKFSRRVNGINKRILLLNMQVPLVRFQIPLINLRREIERIIDHPQAL